MESNRRTSNTRFRLGAESSPAEPGECRAPEAFLRNEPYDPAVARVQAVAKAGVVPPTVTSTRPTSRSAQLREGPARAAPDVTLRPSASGYPSRCPQRVRAQPNEVWHRLGRHS